MVEKVLDAPGVKMALKHLEGCNKFPAELIAYSEETGISMEEILQTPKHVLPVIERAYGSLEVYEEMKSISKKNLPMILVELEKAENAPIGLILMLTKGTKLSQFGINPAQLADIAQEYIRDLATFTSAFLEENVKIRDSGLRDLRKAYKAREAAKAE